MYLLSNDVIANFVDRDLDLLFKVTQFEMRISEKR